MAKSRKKKSAPTVTNKVAPENQAAANPVTGSGSVRRFVLGPLLTIAEAAAFKQSALDWIAGGTEPVQIDGSGVEAADTSGVQILLAFCRDLQDRNIPYTWTGASTDLRQAVVLLGLSGPLGLRES